MIHGFFASTSDRAVFFDMSIANVPLKSIGAQFELGGDHSLFGTSTIFEKSPLELPLFNIETIMQCGFSKKLILEFFAQ